MKKLHISSIFATLFLVAATFTAAQDDREGRPPLERLDHLRKVKLMEALDLKEDQAVKFFAREKEYRTSERKLIHDRVQCADDLELLVKGEAKEADIQKKISEISDLESKILATRWEFLNDARNILTVKQTAQLVLFEQKFQQELRRLIQDAQRERRGRR